MNLPELKKRRILRNAAFFIIFFCIILTTFIGLTTLANQRRETGELIKIAQELKRQNDAIEKQNQNLAIQAETNEELSRKTLRYVSCLSELFAEYTRTGRAVRKVDLDKCNYLTEFRGSFLTGEPSRPLKEPESSQPKAQSNNSNNNTSSGNGNNVSNPPKRLLFPPNEGVVRDDVEVLGLGVGRLL